MAKKLKVSKLTLEQERKLLLKPCKTPQEAKAWIKYFLNLELPDVTVSRYSDTNPFMVIWEVYDICVNTNNPGNIKELLFVAGRGSGKTLGMAIAELMVLLHDKRDVVHVGAIQNQAERCYAYQKNFLYNRRLKPLVMPSDIPEDQRILEKANMSKSIFNVGHEKVTIEVLPCTLKACTDPNSTVILTDGNKILAKNLKVGDLLKTLTKDNSLTEVVKVIRVETINKPCYTTMMSDGSYITAAANHKVLTKNGWLDIADLKPGIKMLRFDNDFSGSNYQLKHEFNSKYATSAIIGMLLGDASLSFKMKDGQYIGNPRMYVGHSLKQEEYLNYCSDAIATKVATKQIRNKKSGYGSAIKEMVTESTEQLLFARSIFYGINGETKKRIHPRIADFLDACSLAFWFMDDGSNGENARFATHGFTVSEVDTLVLALRDKFNLIGASRKLDNCGRPFIILNSASSKLLYKIIAPYVHRSMSYKVQNQSVSKAYRLSDGKKVKFSKNGLPKEDSDTRTYRKWLKKFKQLSDVQVVSAQFVGVHPTIEIETNAESYTQKSYICNGFISHNCNGPHVPLVVVDEIDTVSGEGIKAFAEINGMLDSRNGKQAIRVGISTRKTRYGLMNRQIENAEAEGRTVRRWTAFEFMERCDDKRSGTEKIPLWVNQDKMEVLTDAEYIMKDRVKQKDYVMHEGFTGCAKCPIFSICLTDAKKQTSTSPMLKNLDVDLIQKVRTGGADWALAQLMNLKPSVEGIIFREYDPKIHLKDWNQMWMLLTGKEFPGECSHDIFVAKCHELQLPCYAGIDWGYSSPSTVVFFFMDKRDNVYVVKTDGMTLISNPTWIHHIKTKYHLKYRVQLYAPDQADQGSIQEMKKAGLPTANDAKKPEIMAGIQIIKKLLKVPGGTEAKLFLAKEGTSHIQEEFTLYHYKSDAAGNPTDTPEADNDHWLDALRYPLSILLGKTNLILGGGLDFDNTEGLKDNNGSYSRTPTATEFAASQGIPFQQNEQDASKLGKIGNKSSLEDDPDDDGGNGGGFLWSF
jgi:hypothetical protein